MICLKLNWFFYGLSRMLQFSEFAWPLSYSVCLIDATDRSKISGDQKRFFIALSLYPLSFFANTPFKKSLQRNFYCICAKIIVQKIVRNSAHSLRKPQDKTFHLRIKTNENLVEIINYRK